MSQTPLPPNQLVEVTCLHCKAMQYVITDEAGTPVTYDGKALPVPCATDMEDAIRMLTDHQCSFCIRIEQLDLPHIIEQYQLTTKLQPPAKTVRDSC